MNVHDSRSQSDREACAEEPLPTGDSCILVIFGASGDLTKRKLIPACTTCHARVA